MSDDIAKILGTPILSHKEGLECVVDREHSKDLDSDQLRISTRLCSLSPEDMEWFDEHAPGWQEHISVIVLEATHIIPRAEMFAGLDPFRYAQKTLANKLAEHIVERTEPMLERHTPGVTTHGC